MKKKSLSYTDLSKKQLQNLKETYIQKKINSMSLEELKEFVEEIITHQVNDTIGKEEEMEAWKEMSDFFGEQFEMIILDIQNKHNEVDNSKDIELDPQKQRQQLLEMNKTEEEKKDMWDD